MLKYLCHLTAPVTTTFNADNYRGEPRWERNAVDALLTQGKTVHSTNRIWYSELAKPSNLHDELHLDWLEESALISYGVPHEIHTGSYPEAADPKYRIVQYQDGPSEKTKDTFLKYDRRLSGSIVATCAFKSHDYMAKLQAVLGTGNVEWTYGPTVPCVHEDHDSFTKKNLLWAYRNFAYFAEHHPNGMMRLMEKVSKYLKDDPELRLVILVQPNSDSEENRRVIQTDCRQYFLSFPFAKVLHPYLDRVDVHTSIHWHQVMDIMSNTRLVISPAEPLGGPPFEAASFGIPIVLEQGTNPFIDNGRPMFPELLSAPHGFSDSWFEKIEKLFADENYFHTHGNAYRAFVKQHATFEAYVRKLDEIAAKRGWG